MNAALLTGYDVDLTDPSIRDPDQVAMRRDAARICRTCVVSYPEIDQPARDLTGGRVADDAVIDFVRKSEDQKGAIGTAGSHGPDSLIGSGGMIESDIPGLGQAPEGSYVGRGWRFATSVKLGEKVTETLRSLDEENDAVITLRDSGSDGRGVVAPDAR